MGPFEMVVAIILIVMLGNKTQRLIGNSDTKAMQDEIRMLKDRIQVLERIATDNNSSNDLNRQIEELRNR